MATIEVTETDTPRTYDVQVHDGRRTTRHRVTVPSDLGGAGLPDADHERLVRESFAFLLEREPANAILGEFDLTVITTYFPEYPGEISKRLG